MAQVVATTFSCFIQIVVLNFALNNVKGVCTPTQAEHFTCPGGKVFFSGMSMTHRLDPILVTQSIVPNSPSQLRSSGASLAQAASSHLVKSTRVCSSSSS